MGQIQQQAKTMDIRSDYVQTVQTIRILGRTVRILGRIVRILGRTVRKMGRGDPIIDRVENSMTT